VLTHLALVKVKSLKNAPRTLDQTAKRCFDSSSSTELKK